MLAQGGGGTPSRGPSVAQRAPAEALRPPPVTRGRRGAGGGPQPLGLNQGPPPGTIPPRLSGLGHGAAHGSEQPRRRGQPGGGYVGVTQPAPNCKAVSSKRGRLGQRFPECRTAKGGRRSALLPRARVWGATLSSHYTCGRDCASPTAKRGRTKSSYQAGKPFKISP